jgi:hypothetical protein
MLFIVIFSSLAAAMAIVSQGNLRTTESYRQVNRALAAAETGLAFAQYRFEQVADTVLTTQGAVDQDLADTLWPELRDKIIQDMGDEPHNLEAYTLVDNNHIRLGRTPVGDAPGAPTFQIEVMRHPIAGEDYDAPFYQRSPYNAGAGDNRFTLDGEAVSNANPLTSVWVRIRVEGVDREYSRSVQMDYRLDKKVRYAILSRNRVMIGRNVMIQGSIGSRYTLTNFSNGHPVQIRNNFYGLNNNLDLNLDWLVNYLATYDQDGDNRVKLSHDAEIAGDNTIGDYDIDGDGYVDTYDLFVDRFDNNKDGVIQENEFVHSGGDLYDEKLWRLINEFKYPAGTEFDWTNRQVRYAGESGWVDASADLGVIDHDDDYAKITGRIMLSVVKAAWESGAADGPYQWYTQGPIASDPNDPPITFETSDTDMSNLGAVDFSVDTFKTMATGDLATQVATPQSNGGLTPAYTAPSFDTREAVPFRSPHPYDYYERPVYENYVFENITIPKGSNALFVNCKFIGVTFVETTISNDDPNYNYAGMQNLDGTLTYLNATATVEGAVVADTKTISNNVRFHDCTFEGMVASDAATTYAHVRNKIQFTGNTQFDLDSNNLTDNQRDLFRKSTIMAPQYSVDMGTFTNPDDTGENVQLDGAIIAGVFDIRGNATIDGSVITTYEPELGAGVLAWGGNPASMNTTIGYFESTAGDSEGEVPDEGYGKIIIRYDPDRALPDGINGPIEFDPAHATYHEGL